MKKYIIAIIWSKKKKEGNLHKTCETMKESSILNASNCEGKRSLPERRAKFIIFYSMWMRSIMLKKWNHDEHQQHDDNNVGDNQQWHMLRSTLTVRFMIVISVCHYTNELCMISHFYFPLFFPPFQSNAIVLECGFSFLQAFRILIDNFLLMLSAYLPYSLGFWSFQVDEDLFFIFSVVEFLKLLKDY